jgi:hypothetical protein
MNERLYLNPHLMDQTADNHYYYGLLNIIEVTESKGKDGSKIVSYSIEN